MKHKLLYGISGLLALCVLGITVFAPDFYFLYWDWDRKNEVQSENLYFSEQMDPLDISQELELLAMFQLSDSSSDHLYRYTETFLPTEREIPENALFQSIRQQFFQLKDNFNETPFFSSICETLSKIDQDHIVNSYLCQLVNLETTTYGFSMWKVHVETEFSTYLADSLAQRGHKIVFDTNRGGFGKGQMILRTPFGTLIGGTEPRCEGACAAW